MPPKSTSTHSVAYGYDNRLIAMESAPSVPTTAKRKLEFAYDSRGRRIRKRVHDWNGTAYVLAGERRYAYDGNGNVMALVRGSDGAVSGRYEYGPFGELLEVEEDGIENPFRFSTKFQDGETGLLYYGFRYYNPETGRWPSRDPIGERGGINLYGFVGNGPVNGVDYLGFLEIVFVSEKTCKGDMEWWKEHFDGVVIGPVSSNTEIMQELIPYRNSNITAIHLSGHGYGAGTALGDPGENFHISELIPGDRDWLRSLLGPGGQIFLWSCDTADGKKKKDDLQAMSDSLQVTVWGKDGKCSAGADGGRGTGVFSNFATWWVSGFEDHGWVKFTPSSNCDEKCTEPVTVMKREGKK